MAIQIRVSDTTYQEKLITINREKLFITFSFNTRDNNWYFDLTDRDNNDLITGVKILPVQNLTSKYIDVSNLLQGDFFCVDLKDNKAVIGRDNFGTDKQFQFWYISDIEQEELANGTTV